MNCLVGSIISFVFIVFVCLAQFLPRKEDA